MQRIPHLGLLVKKGGMIAQLLQLRIVRIVEHDQTVVMEDSDENVFCNALRTKLDWSKWLYMAA